jgi:hypothetical protein
MSINDPEEFFCFVVQYLTSFTWMVPECKSVTIIAPSVKLKHNSNSTFFLSED